MSVIAICDACYCSLQYLHLQYAMPVIAPLNVFHSKHPMLAIARFNIRHCNVQCLLLPMSISAIATCNVRHCPPQYLPLHVAITANLPPDRLACYSPLPSLAGRLLQRGVAFSSPSSIRSLKLPARLAAGTSVASETFASQAKVFSFAQDPSLLAKQRREHP